MIDYFKTQHLIEQMISDRIVPGVNYTFIKKDQVTNSTIGLASLIPNKTQLNPFSLYDLASLTKVLGTTNVFLKLYQDGVLNFTEPLNDFIPDFKDRRVRLFHLLTHTSGIKGWIPNRDQLPAPELLKAIINLPVTEEFETRMRYADTNFILLGLVLEKIYHQSVQQVIKEQVIYPAKLKNTTFNPVAGDCVPTALLVNGKILQGVVHDPKARTLGKDCGSAGMFSNMNDLIKMAQGYLGLRDDSLPISQDTITELYSIHTPKRVHARSWGWDLCFDPIDKHPILYHTGFTGTFMLLDRLNQSGLIVLTNRIHPSGHNEIFLSIREKIVATFLQENTYKH
ncbi:CubicO group peptidase (beta-lactamase class C family) [Lactobacillus colini]|uniref:CubicO group peptidase (Beta-lactamase class C family) n=1 Tax=Lactobacillus colini TaxID=1819254 RepID=A0ABS4MDT4_9LACO|nr:serine hydrolase domain-containing protein [Lactobacillus colini]MBP2057852.1 CubicO group peptidase (beta-lactamase class C family) [Lactobacillus colini]